MIRINERLECLVLQKHIRYLIPIGRLIIVEGLVKLVENDMGVEFIQFQICQFLSPGISRLGNWCGLLSASVLLNRYQQNIACHENIPDDVVIGWGSVYDAEIVDKSLQSPF